MMSEKIQLLGAGLYKNIPNELTLKSMPTSTELDYVGSEDFEATMLDKILPQCIEEPINCRELLEIDFQWVCRCLRLLNYGPYFTVNRIFCGKCDHMSSGEYSVDLRTVGCKTLPDNFKNGIKISKEEFINFDKDITVKLPTIQDIINAYKDSMFVRPNGSVNKEYARICYMIESIGNEDKLTPVQIKLTLDKLSAADYGLLKGIVTDLTDYGLRAGGSTKCPKCGNNEAAFIALVDDRFLYPTLGDLKQWRADLRRQAAEDSARD